MTIIFNRAVSIQFFKLMDGYKESDLDQLKIKEVDAATFEVHIRKKRRGLMQETTYKLNPHGFNKIGKIVEEAEVIAPQETKTKPVDSGKPLLERTKKELIELAVQMELPWDAKMNNDELITLITPFYEPKPKLPKAEAS